MHHNPITPSITVSPIMFGAAPIGNMPDTYGYAVDEARALATINAIFDGPANCIDTANNYGFGESERRIGHVIRERGGLPDGFVVSTKLDRDMDTNRMDASRARQSLEESLTRLNLDKIDILHLHDPEYARDPQELEGALAELTKMKEEGLAGSIGLAMGKVDLQLELLKRWDMDCIISHNRYTLINRNADALFDYCQEKAIAVLNAAPYASGVLAKGADIMPLMTYQQASEAMLVPVRQIEAICADHHVEPGALALQFSLKDKRVASTIVGVTKPERIQQTMDWASVAIPETVWAELERFPATYEDPEANRDYKPG